MKPKLANTRYQNDSVWQLLVNQKNKNPKFCQVCSGNKKCSVNPTDPLELGVFGGSWSHQVGCSGSEMIFWHVDVATPISGKCLTPCQLRSFARHLAILAAHITMHMTSNNNLILWLFLRSSAGRFPVNYVSTRHHHCFRLMDQVEFHPLDTALPESSWSSFSDKKNLVKNKRLSHFRNYDSGPPKTL